MLCCYRCYVIDNVVIDVTLKMVSCCRMYDHKKKKLPNEENRSAFFGAFFEFHSRILLIFKPYLVNLHHHDDCHCNNTITFPFCSLRCKRIDLGRWFGERYKLQGHDYPEDFHEENESE